MELDNSAVEEFQRLYFQEFGIKLNKQEAIELGSRLVKLVKTVYGRDLPERKKLDSRHKK